MQCSINRQIITKRCRQWTPSSSLQLSVYTQVSWCAQQPTRSILAPCSPQSITMLCWSSSVPGRGPCESSECRPCFCPRPDKSGRHRPNIVDCGLNLVELGPKLIDVDRHRPKVPTLGTTLANIGELARVDFDRIGPNSTKFGPEWAKFGPNSAKCGPMSTMLCPNSANFNRHVLGNDPKLPEIGQVWPESSQSWAARGGGPMIILERVLGRVVKWFRAVILSS